MTKEYNLNKESMTVTVNALTFEDMCSRITDLEAKLEKVVEAAEELSDAFYSDGNVTERHLRACKAGVKLHATLAELKGQGDE